jgi:outer membrane lipoprotein-sorting protein
MMAVLIVALLALSGCAASSVEETAKPASARGV